LFFSLDFDGTITAYGGGNGDDLNTIKAGPGTIYIQDGKGNSLMKRLWIIGNTEDPGFTKNYHHLLHYFSCHAMAEIQPKLALNTNQSINLNALNKPLRERTL
jgi:hypothetical protein